MNLPNFLRTVFEFEAIRKKFSRSATEPIHSHKYVVNILIEHPQIIGGSVFKFRVGIDANSKAHARRRLREELKIVIGNARKI